MPDYMGPNNFYDDGLDQNNNQNNVKGTKSEIIIGSGKDKQTDIPNPYIEGSTEHMKSLRQKKEIA